MEAFLRRRSTRIGLPPYHRGFTLVEILVVVAIISILASEVAIYSLQSGRVSRDAQRQADLREMQAAVELYKQRHGRYPEACGSPPRVAPQWAGEILGPHECFTTGATATRTPQYIVGANGRWFTDFMDRLPSDPARGSGEGYAYMTNAEGTVYKIIAMNTVESEVVSVSHPLKSCDVKPDELGSNIDIRIVGLCGARPSGGTAAMITTADDCHPEGTLTNDRFETSYAVWGGFAPVLADGDTGNSGGCRSISGTVTCLHPNPPDARADSLNVFMNWSNKATTTISQENNANIVRVRGLRHTTDVICS